jgi:[ribosomal protein S5]-alanine N-acetyltransferase
MTIKPLQTERLLLRFFTPGDEEIHRLVFDDPEVAVPFCGRTRTIDEVRDWLVCRAYQAQVDEFGFWAIVRKRDEALLGLVALQAYVPDWIVWPDDPQPEHSRIEVELAYALGRDCWGNGYATEAGSAVIGYAFEDLRLPHIAYSVDSSNHRSMGVMRRLGFCETKNLHPSGADTFLGVLRNSRSA